MTFCVDWRIEEPSAHREEELLQASDTARPLGEPSEEAAGCQVEEEKLYSLNKRVAQRTDQTAAKHQ